ncbi:transporter [Penicillium diatomitis]|uniref:Transporter n=1 Tax=Penicillium diatomitis TaxID=2819901 RepID=A0A9W9WVH7_9EURO|nr:transporter [Penicillium diatomitis]KAJ5477461.1 transporter [Penicillium diatomitis]
MSTLAEVPSRILSGPLATLASSQNCDSYELTDFNATGGNRGTNASEFESTSAQRFGGTVRPFKPAASSVALAGLDWVAIWKDEKVSFASHRPRAPRNTRLKYWTEALRSRTRRLAEECVSETEKVAKMKFSHSIQFNAVPDWSSNYIAYSNLKKLIYTLEKQANHVDGQSGADVESAPLLGGAQVNNPDAVFKRALDTELDKVCTFYQQKQAEIFQTTDELLHEAMGYLSETAGVNMDPVSETVIKARTLSSNSRYGNTQRRRSSVSEDDADSDDENPATAVMGLARQASIDGGSTNDDHRHGDMSDSNFFAQSGSRLLRDPDMNDQAFLALYNAGVSLKKRLIESYVSLCELRSFIELNRTGFSKALKKYDKTLFRNTRRDYLASVVHPAQPFTDSTMAAVDNYIQKVEGAYADVVTKGNRELASRELRLHLREHVVWERNTVWREMIEIERRAQAANVGIRRTLLGADEDPATAIRQGDKTEIRTTEFKTPFGRIEFPLWLCSLSFGALVFSLAVFGALLSVPIMKSVEQQNCLAMLVLVSILWATEAIPLFVTSLLIPFLVVILGIMRSDGKPYKRLPPKEATKMVFASMWTPVIMLLLGGFTIAAALSKYDIARRMAMFVLSKAGSKPKIVLLTNMFVSMFLSMWISNVASPVLCYSIIQPLLRNLSPDSDFAKALVLGIALAANVGGAASPIASPQNIIALQNMYPSISWGTWFFISLPVCIISILLIWVLLLVTFNPGRNATVIPMRPVKDRFTGVQYFISAVTLVTIALWCASHQLEHVFGDMGVIAIIPLVLFFGTGILNKEDFNNFLWTIIILAAGGLCLGKAVTSSGLLHTIASGITARVEHLSLYGVLIVFSVLILVIATFISHTVAALIILPLVRQIGVGMEEPHPNLLVMASALMCSVAMALPTSGFPNMTAIMTEVPQTGQRYLQVRHFLTRGIPASLMSFVVIVTVGYGLMLVAGL